MLALTPLNVTASVLWKQVLAPLIGTVQANAVGLTDLDGQRTTVDFTWYVDGAQVKLIALSVDTPAEVGKLKKRLGLSYDVYSDREGAALRGFRVDDQNKGIARPAIFLGKYLAQ